MNARCCAAVVGCVLALLAARGAGPQAVRQLPHDHAVDATASAAAGTSRCATSTSRSGSTPTATARSPGARCAPNTPTSRPMPARAWRCAADGQACRVAVGAQMLEQHTDGAYSVLPLAHRLRRRGRAARRGLHAVRRHRPAAPRPAEPACAGRRAQRGARTRRRRRSASTWRSANRWAQFVDYLREGVWHIWIGFDHILFLLSLLLPAVLLWRATALAAGGRLPRRVLGRVPHRHGVHRGALDHACRWPRCT